MYEVRTLHRNPHLLGSQMHHTNTSESTVNMFTITMFPGAANNQDINIPGVEFSRIAEIECQKLSYVNM